MSVRSIFSRDVAVSQRRSLDVRASLVQEIYLSIYLSAGVGDADQADQADPARQQRRPARDRAPDPQGEQDDLGAWGEARGRYINP